VFLLRALDTHMEDGLLTAVLARAGRSGWQRAALADLIAVAERRQERVDVGEVADDQLDDARATS
jgi:hypothetical protein